MIRGENFYLDFILILLLLFFFLFFFHLFLFFFWLFFFFFFRFFLFLFLLLFGLFWLFLWLFFFFYFLWLFFLLLNFEICYGFLETISGFLEGWSCGWHKRILVFVEFHLVYWWLFWAFIKLLVLLDIKTDELLSLVVFESFLGREECVVEGSLFFFVGL